MEILKCQFCGKNCKSIISVKAHERYCIFNPNSEKKRTELQSIRRRGLEAANEVLRKRTLENPLNQFKEYSLTCPKCGKVFLRRIKVRDFNKGSYMKYCCRSCANSRPMTEERRRRISLGVNNFLKEKFGSSLQEKPQSLKEHVKTQCTSCGKEIYVKRTGPVYCYECADKLSLKHVQLFTREGKKCSSEATKKKLKDIFLKRVKDGTHKGWNSRNIESYPERFWKKVLQNNKIKYIFNAPISKKKLGLYGEASYFLDFLINENIDLEIDGKQHLYDERVQSDKQRDEALLKNGYYVYRIFWNEINTKEGKQLMKDKINRFLSFIKNIPKQNTLIKDY